jgi:hypothetical protein
MKQSRLSQCFECVYHHINPDYMIGPCGKKQRIPRKWKKRLKQFLHYTRFSSYNNCPVPIVSSCEIADDYNKLKLLFSRTAYFKKYQEEILFLIKWSKEGDERILLDDNLILGFFWEMDDDYTGGCSGIEPLKFEPPTPNDNTWQYQELKSILKNLGMKISDYKSEEQLLSGLKRIGVKELNRRGYSLDYIETETEDSVFNEPIFND